MNESTRLRFKKQKLVKYLPISLFEGYLLTYTSSIASLKQQSVIFHVHQEKVSEILRINYLTNMVEFQDKGLFLWNYSLIPKLPRRTTTTCWLKPFQKHELITIHPPRELQEKQLLGLNIKKSQEGIILISQSLYILKEHDQEFFWVEIDVEKREQAQFFWTDATSDLLIARKKDKTGYVIYRVTKESAEIIAELPHVIGGLKKRLWPMIPREIILYPSQSIDKAEKIAIAFDSAKTQSLLGIISLSKSNLKWETIPRPYYSPVTATSVNGQQGVVFVRQQKKGIFNTRNKVVLYTFVDQVMTDIDNLANSSNQFSLFASVGNDKLVIGSRNGELLMVDLHSLVNKPKQNL